MYNLPSTSDVSKVVVDEAVINGETQPYLIYDQNLTEKKQLKIKSDPEISKYTHIIMVYVTYFKDKTMKKAILMNKSFPYYP